MQRSDAILKRVRGPRVLDVGCTGHVVELDSPRWVHGRLRERFPEVAGIDISPENIARLEKAGFSDLHLASAEDFSLGRQFDTIVAGELIEHLSNPGCFLERCREHLAPGGQVVVTTPHAFSLLYALYALVRYPRTCENPEHTVWFCRSTLGELARRAGFDVEHFELFSDYNPGAGSRAYRVFARLMRALGFLVPLRLRATTMLMELRLAAPRPGDGGKATG